MPEPTAIYTNWEDGCDYLHSLFEIGEGHKRRWCAVSRGVCKAADHEPVWIQLLQHKIAALVSVADVNQVVPTILGLKGAVNEDDQTPDEAMQHAGVQAELASASIEFKIPLLCVELAASNVNKQVASAPAPEPSAVLRALGVGLRALSGGLCVLSGGLCRSL